MSQKQKKPKRIDTQAQIAARVAPAPCPANVIKKVYKENSPGAVRKALGITLTGLKARINEPDAKITYGVDEFDQPTGEIISVEPFRNTAACTKRRRHAVANGALGRSNIGSKRRHVRNSYAAVNTQGTKPSKKARSTGASKKATK